MSDKILKLSQAQALYNDLRERVDALPTSSDIPEVPVQDVQVNGMSIISNNVAYISMPITGSNSNYGILVSQGIPRINPAQLSSIKMNYGTATEAQQTQMIYKPITPRTQHQAVFYGLATAAGDTTQSQSDNTVGIYTNEAKSAIQNMLNVTSKNIIALEYEDLTFPVVRGQYCIHENELFISNSNIENQEEWNSSHWTKQNKGISERVQTIYSDINNVIAPLIVQRYVKPASGIPASDLADGVIPNLTNLIDDTAGAGDTDKVWSANKLTNDISAKADKTDTILETTLSRGRVDGSQVGKGSMAFGQNVVASGAYSHAEGRSTHASGGGSHAEGYGTVSWFQYTRASGCYNSIDVFDAWPQWVANQQYNVNDKVWVLEQKDGANVRTGYICTVANNDSEFTVSHWSQATKGVYVEMVGNGSSAANRSNAYALDWDGNGHYAGDVYVGCNPDSTGGEKLVKESELSDVNFALNANSEKLGELAENGYYTEGGQPQDVYLQLTSGGINSTGTISGDYSKGYIWLTSEQESLTLKIDTSVYSYNLCYMNGSSVAKYTGWQTTSPIEFDSTTHTQIGITVKKTAGGYINTLLNEILYYTSGGQTTVGNLATKNYVVAKQQSALDSGKVLGIGSDGIVVPVEQSGGVDVDDTLSIAGDAADAKKTGDVLKELAINGEIVGGNITIYIPTAIGMVKNTSPATIDPSSTDTAYVKLSSLQETKQISFDTTKYKVNFAYFKNNSKTGFTSWITSSPVMVDGSIAHDEAYINVRKLSGLMDNTEILTCLSYTDISTVGDLATRAFVESFNPKGSKCIYPDGFASRIMPDIYYNGKFYSDINVDSFKISGGSVWVATDGNDATGDGTENNPYATITKALTANVPTIHIKNGTYEMGTHYATNVNYNGKNIIGHGTVILQDDTDGHSQKTTGSAYFENIVFKHGNASSNPAFYASCSGSNQTVCFVGCTFRDGGGNGLALTGIDAVLVNCIAYGNKLDGFNYHDATVGNVVYVPNVLEIDCVAYNNGSSESGSDSCNGSTAHDGAKVIRLNGEYYSCYGGVIAEIARTGEEPTISVNYGVIAHDSTGTGTYKASFWASINTKMYLYDCKSYGGTYDISAINDALVVSRRLTTGRDVPAVNVASTATVLQY